METGISNYSVYLHRMQQSVLDKLFFFDKIFEPVKTIVDFGCANGEMLKSLQLFSCDYRFIGYDISQTMIEAAKENVPNVEFYSNWDEIQLNPEESLVNISSTIHEVYSYGTEADVAQFWDRMLRSGFKYVSIRDMMVSDADEAAPDERAMKILRADRRYADKLADYEEHWGSIQTQSSLVHYLLKYSYTENWTREVRENYLPITVEKLLAMVPDDYEITYHRHYVLPYTAWQIKRDFGIELTTPTHAQLLLKKK